MNNLALFVPEMLNIAKPGKPVRVLGVDLGTTNTSAAEILWSPASPGSVKAQCLEINQKLYNGNGYTSSLVPSVVALINNFMYIGEGAKQLRARSEELSFLQNKNIFYECKNDMGIRKTYAAAPEGFRSASAISSKILKLIYDEALKINPSEINRSVVTVPASFQVAQRQDTILAAHNAGLEIGEGDLLDEPIAAFIDYLISYRNVLKGASGEAKNLLVFDFGGGTCDVSIFNLSVPESGYPVKVFPLAASRYHRLGGGDIDRAIVYEVLIPEILSLNNLSKFDLSYEDKKEYFEPFLLGIAEELKIQLCDEISRLRQKPSRDGSDKAVIAGVKPGIFTFNVRGRRFVLNVPRLTAKQFEDVLVPFLDEDLLYARETEYRMTCSIFAPLQDCLDRARIDSEKVDYCLLLGGSSLIPQVADAVKKFFPEAAMLQYPDRQSLQTAVAKGAAFHALSLQLFGKGIVQQICYDTISLRTESGTIPLVPRGAEIPYPAPNQYKRIYDLAVPKTIIDDDLELKVELVAGEEKRLLYRAIWNIPGPVNKGDPLCLEYCLNENQVLDINIKLEETEEFFVDTIENPLTNIINPAEKMERILEIEEDLKTGAIQTEKVPAKMLELGTNYAGIGHKEKAIHVLKKALKIKGSPDAYILNSLGNYYADLGNDEKADKFYRESAKVATGTGAHFNLCLFLRRRKQYAEAIQIMDDIISRERLAPYLVQRALLASETGNQEEFRKYLEESLSTFGPLQTLSEWELGWYQTAAEKDGNVKKVQEIKWEKQKRLEKNEDDIFDYGILPIMRQGIVKYAS